MRCTSVVLLAVASTSFAAVHIGSVKRAEASCGLDYCSWPQEKSEKSPLGEAQLLVRHVDFSLGGTEGSYQESLVRLQYTGLKDTKLGLWVAPIVLSVAGERHTGISNPVLFAERRFGLSGPWALSGAMQVELPLGSDEEGMASAHAELLPYAGVTYESDRFHAQIQTGFAFAIDSGHSHDHGGGTMLYVNPHSDQELLGRLALMVPLANHRFLPGLHINGRYSLDQELSERAFVTTALVSSVKVSDAFNLLAQAEVPVSPGKRFQWRAGAGASVNF